MKISIDSRKISNINDLMKTIEKLLYSTWGKDKIQFFAAYPKLNDPSTLSTPIITYKYSKVPGRLKNATEIKPRLREAIKIEDTNLPINGEVLEIWGQIFDYTVEFEIWGQSGKEVEEITDKFQKFIFKYTGYLKKIGVNEIIFEKLTPSEIAKNWRTDLITRKIVYFIRIDEVTGAKVPTLENIVIEKYLHETSFIMDVEVILREEYSNENSNT